MAELFQNVETGASAFDGCPDPTAGKSAIVWQGMQSRVCHKLTLADGTPVNLSAFATLESSTVQLRRVGCNRQVHTIELLEADFVGAEEGQICFDLPAAVDGKPGIYVGQIVLRNEDGRPVVGDQLLISVEATMMQKASNPGPITIGDVRRALRDYPALNVAWETAEFSNEEILAAVMRPVQRFNETLPRVLSFSMDNFPYREEWLRATVAFLLEMANHWYARNSRELKYGDGMTEDDKNKVNVYASMAQHAIAKFENFCVNEQVVANFAGVRNLGGTVH